MIKSGGENIYPAEIERVLLLDPRVSDAIVVRRKDERWGEVPIAFVSRNDNSLFEEEVEALCRKELAGYKHPKAVHFIRFEDFPRRTTGKILRHEMEARLKAALEAHRPARRSVNGGVHDLLLRRLVRRKLLHHPARTTDKYTVGEIENLRQVR